MQRALADRSVGQDRDPLTDGLDLGQRHVGLLCRCRRRASFRSRAPKGRPSDEARRPGLRRIALGRAGRFRGRRCRRRPSASGPLVSSITSPRSTVVLFQSGLVSVLEITYLGIALNLSATSPFIVGEVLERSGLVIRSRRAQLRPSRLQGAPLNGRHNGGARAGAHADTRRAARAPVARVDGQSTARPRVACHEVSRPARASATSNGVGRASCA
jgi:hypothetical protein